MTKKKASYCDSCQFFSGAPCRKGHYPRFYKIDGAKRICSDYATFVEQKKIPTFLEVFFHTLFGSKNAPV